jgi:hypothetical protein
VNRARDDDNFLSRMASATHRAAQNCARRARKIFLLRVDLLLTSAPQSTRFLKNVLQFFL